MTFTPTPMSAPLIDRSTLAPNPSSRPEDPTAPSRAVSSVPSVVDDDADARIARARLEIFAGHAATACPRASRAHLPRVAVVARGDDARGVIVAEIILSAVASRVDVSSGARRVVASSTNPRWLRDSFQKIRSARECDARGESGRAREGSARRR